MKLVFFSHPSFLGSQSMPRYSAMLAKGMRERGHSVEIWAPRPHFFKLPFPDKYRKWLGYIDQYVLFPKEVRSSLRKKSSDTLFVFTDHALGPWVPMVADRPHVIHCHDFMAQQSAQGQVLENVTGYTGRKYQTYIHQGYSKGKNFISVSQKTRRDLHEFLPWLPAVSEVVYNGLNPLYQPFDAIEARTVLSRETGIELGSGYLLHVGGNQWYKNRLGVIELYDAWRCFSFQSLPMLLAGEKPSEALLQRRAQSPYRSDIHFIEGLSDNHMRLAYAGASVFLFPSLAEGFGWPIAEAMAAGCPVITTNEAPMTEVAGNAAFLIPRRPSNSKELKAWAEQGAQAVIRAVNMPVRERSDRVAAGMENARRFNVEDALDRMEIIYREILACTP
ncbi:glycosyltransferase [Paraflavisolibacter sp. H34]|uniref:glycosyltransferase n=1 Tax=Huijunlia imazamoxiresistens TaxID=3127457 RepID=UPI003016DC5F